MFYCISRIEIRHGFERIYQALLICESERFNPVGTGFFLQMMFAVAADPASSVTILESH